MNIVQALAFALALSIGVNGVLGWVWLGARDTAAKATVQRDDARSAASACSDATEDLRDLADKRAAEAKKAQAAARSAATAAQDRANAILSAPAAVPGDACASAQVSIDDWLRGRVPK